MKVNWPERIWVNSSVRRYVQEREATFFKKLHNLSSGAHCLEIGCGSGMGAKIICRSFSPASLHAIDIDEDMLYAAKRKSAAWHSVPLLLLAADAQQLPFPDQCFDAVFNYGIIHHLEDWQRGVQEIGRVLKDKGIFYFEEIYPPLYANFLFRLILQHPRENRFHGPQFRDALTDSRLLLLDGYKESKFAILGAAVKKNRSKQQLL